MAVDKFFGTTLQAFCPANCCSHCPSKDLSKDRQMLARWNIYRVKGMVVGNFLLEVVWYCAPRVW
jgi:hypothetical protein